MVTKEKMNKLENYVFSLDASFHDFLKSIAETAEKINEILKIIHEEDFANMPIASPEKAYEILLSVTMGIKLWFDVETRQDTIKVALRIPKLGHFGCVIMFTEMPKGTTWRKQLLW